VGEDVNSAQLINQTSGDYEWYTPPAIIEAARKAMGSIDLDPASSEQANKIVKAGKFFTIEDDGLKQDWFGNIWLNHPFGRVENPLWIQKLANEYSYPRVQQVCCITYACTSEAWFQPLHSGLQCYLTPRTNYLLPDGTPKRGVTKGSVVTYFGPRRAEFADAFIALGVTKEPWIHF
jgi:ParB family chromosome partitioning protein